MLLNLSCEQVRQIDQDAVAQIGLPSLILMENAARGVCDVIRRRQYRSITIVAGPGNNGGDGLAVARQLAAFGISADVFLCRAGKRLSNDASQNLLYLTNCGISVVEPSPEDLQQHCQQLSKEDLIVDALLGTGIRGVVQSPFAELIMAINQSAAAILSVDVPSGMDCDRGEPCGVCVMAESTVTFVAEKSGFRNPDARRYTGSVDVCHIGIPQRWLQEWAERIRL